MPFILNNQMIHQESGTSNLYHITSNKGSILPKPVLWFQISWEYLITMPLLMLMLRLTLQIFQLNITLNMFQTQTPLQSNQLMIMKWNIYWNYSIQNMIWISWIFTSTFFRLDWCLPLFQNFIQSLLCCFINTEERMLQSQMVCHTFLCLSQPRPL